MLESWVRSPGTWLFASLQPVTSDGVIPGGIDMPDAPIEPPANDRHRLLQEWERAADVAAHNLGVDKMLPDLCPEHWQWVLASVEARMKLRGVPLPLGWEKALALQVGRRQE
ncbi:hypothetical protein [Methylobacterium iners]|uniref:Uncharacterized protein n=1 Tax=Methylobacterium iners TaxID=418707 RepID=A0ABQ4S2P0_9HYPH|nr:hypothetical protein [Methylobacterium iners]GJD96895.1 hypothetical protein OCOJLMKI_4122 [Methylobacterium iners]